jgi:hypothetical protein
VSSSLAPDHLGKAFARANCLTHLTPRESTDLSQSSTIHIQGKPTGDRGGIRGAQDEAGIGWRCMTNTRYSRHGKHDHDKGPERKSTWEQLLAGSNRNWKHGGRRRRWVWSTQLSQRAWRKDGKWGTKRRMALEVTRTVMHASPTTSTSLKNTTLAARPSSPPSNCPREAQTPNSNTRRLFAAHTTKEGTSIIRDHSP